MSDTRHEHEDDNSFERRQMIRAISSFEGFPTMNPRSMRIIAMLKEKLVNIPRLARILERNHDFRQHFIKLSGVPDMGSGSIKEAIRALGLLNVKHLVFSFIIMPFYSANDREEWEHVYSTSILISNMLKHFRIPETSSLPLVALLHDIGVPLLRRFNPSRYEQIKKYARDNNLYLEDVEDANLYITHAVAGGICIKKWGMHDDVFFPVTHHHIQEFIEGDEEQLKELYLLQYADWIDHCVRGLTCYRPNHAILKHFGYEVDDEYWLDFQKDVVNHISFGKAEFRGSSSECIQHLVAPLGFVEKVRREEEKHRKHQEAGAKKSFSFDIAKAIKDKLNHRKHDDSNSMTETNTIENFNPEMSIEDVEQNSDTVTTVFKRPKPQEPVFELDEDNNKPLRLRSDGKVLETVTTVFKRPIISKNKDENI